MEEDLDATLRRFGQEFTTEAEKALLGTGEAGLRRMLEAFLGRRSLDWPGSGVDGIDRFNHALSLLTVGHPGVFIEEVRRHPVRWWGSRTTVAVILGQIGDVSSADILCRYSRDRQWLVRLHCARALGEFGDDRARRCIERLLNDEAWMVRVVATQAVSRWDSGRAIALYEEWLAERPRLLRRKAIDPAARREIDADLDDLRTGRPIPPTRPWRAGRL